MQTTGRGLLLDVPKGIYRRKKIDVRSKEYTNQQKGTATLEMDFIVKGQRTAESYHKNCAM